MRIPHRQPSRQPKETQPDGLGLREDRPVVEVPVGDDVGPAGVVCSGEVSGEVVERI